MAALRALTAVAGAALVGFLATGACGLGSPAAPEPSPAAGRVEPQATTGPGWRDRPDLRSYAVALDDLHGLSPAAAPGTRLRLWVTYGPPVTRRVRHYVLIEEAFLEKIAPAVTPAGPDAALLLVPADDIRDLVTAEIRGGSLSATTLR